MIDLATLQSKLGAAISGGETAYGEVTLHAEPAQILAVLAKLQSEPDLRFVSFIDICGADYPEREKRFDVVYHLLSPYKNSRVRIKVQVDEQAEVPSAVGIFPAADWFEREVYDFYGVLFSGHPDLRRILTDYGFSGHPLRQDFPFPGFVAML